MIERALEVQKEVDLCFIDYNRVRHDEIITHLTVEDKWTRSASDQKLVLGTHSNNAS